MKTVSNLTTVILVVLCCIQIILCEENDNIMKMIAEAQYPVQKYTVQTSDGYILSIHRIPNSPKIKTTNDKKQVALLLHGLMNSAADFLALGPQKSLPYKLADAGFDVWLGNTRGNTFSRKHASLDPEERDYWEFSWHESAIYDLPAIIDFILTKTGESKIYAIGHSQGSTIFTVLLTELPAYNQKMHSVFLLTPLIFFKNPSPLPQLIGNNVNQIQNAITVFDFFEIFPTRPIIHGIVTMLCDPDLETSIICRDVIFALAGTSTTQYNASVIMKVAENAPAGSGYKQHIHYYQMVKTGKFQKFDHGSDNMKVYGQSTPPEYDISKLTAKFHIFYGDQDQIVVEKDSLYAIEQLGSNVVTKECVADFNHFDFVWGNNADTMVYDKIIQAMK